MVGVDAPDSDLSIAGAVRVRRRRGVREALDVEKLPALGAIAVALDAVGLVRAVHVRAVGAERELAADLVDVEPLPAADAAAVALDGVLLVGAVLAVVESLDAVPVAVLLEDELLPVADAAAVADDPVTLAGAELAFASTLERVDAVGELRLADAGSVGDGEGVPVRLAAEPVLLVDDGRAGTVDEAVDLDHLRLAVARTDGQGLVAALELEIHAPAVAVGASDGDDPLAALALADVVGGHGDGFAGVLVDEVREVVLDLMLAY